VLVTELGIVHATKSEMEAAMAAWGAVLERTPTFLPAYMNLGQLALHRGDTVLMQKLVDHALATVAPHPEMLRRGVQLALVGEPEGVARATRVAELARRVSKLVPDDAAARVILAQSLVQLGERDAALEELARVERTAKGTPAAAEAQRGLLALREPDAAKAIDATLLAARNAPAAELESVIARARGLLHEHGAWTAAFAVAVAEGRAGHVQSARDALLRVLEIAPGCLPAHAELVGMCIRLGDGAAALTHAEALHMAEGDSPRTLLLLSRAKHAAGLEVEARALAARVLSLDPTNEEAKVLSTVPAPSRPSWIQRLLGFTKKE
jgi:tetratricopeptide (TPR) repeat protein